MGLFSRHANASASTLRVDIVDRVTTYIRFELDPAGSGIGPSRINELIYQPLFPLAQSDPAGFTKQLAAAVLPAGGLAARGGARVVRELISGDFDDPNFHAMLDAALEWLRRSGVGVGHLTGCEADRCPPRLAAASSGELQSSTRTMNVSSSGTMRVIGCNFLTSANSRSTSSN